MPCPYKRMNVDVWLLTPEILLAIWACVVLIVDLAMPSSASRRPLLALSLLGIAGAALASFALLGTNTTSFFGMLIIDNVSVFFKLLFLLAAALVVLASETFTEHGEFTAEFYGLILFCTAALMLMASTNELMSIYLSLETSSLSLALLASWSKRELRSGEAGLKFFVLSAVSSAVLLFGMALFYGVTGRTDLRAISQVLITSSSPAALLAMSMVIAGLGFKIAAVPFQMWTPDVYEGAPTPITAYLSVASKGAGFAVVIRIFEGALLGGAIQPVWMDLFVLLSLLTMTVGNLAALLQRNLKRMLAYSSIAHVGYMLMGLAAATTFGLSSVLFYLLVYAFTNIGAFAVVTVMARYVEGEDLEQYSGLARRAPVLSAILALCLLSLAGLPPLAGFFSKLYLFWAAAERGLYATVTWGVINSAISLYYYTRVIRQMYLAEPATDSPVSVGLAPAVSLAAAALGVLAIGIFASPFIEAARGAALVITR
ncbi:MAG TPA: NADH-quinone oxidoreductase subunit N [Chloroflexota bacterium]|nr:NADH-quinone oxidoreductase subunit N [Chloroflexota bacterium]